jgi:hypothetical protein
MVTINRRCGCPVQSVRQKGGRPGALGEPSLPLDFTPRPRTADDKYIALRCVWRRILRNSVTRTNGLIQCGSFLEPGLISGLKGTCGATSIQPDDVTGFADLIVRSDRYVPDGIAGTPGVTMVDRYQEYLTKAEEAEKQAEMAADHHARDGWLKVASGYRDLASMSQAQRRDRRWKA